jgi:DNA-binding response OmpR family regulator
MKNILIIEDDIALSNGIILALRGDAFTFSQAYDLAAAKQKMEQESYDLVILDINLPDGNGLDFLSKIRKTAALPVIVLTANDMETDIVAGLETGADDYITKPFSLMVLRARVNAQFRKSRPSIVETVEIDRFSFCFDRMEFSKNGNLIELSKTEQKLLKILLENKGTTLTRAKLVDHIWTDGAEYVDENALSVTIKRLRDKLEDTPSTPQYIKTVYGIGYTWAVK